MSVSLRVTDCWTVHMPLSEKLPVNSLSWFSVAIPHLGTLQGGKYKYFSIFPHFSLTVIFYFFLVIWWLLPIPPSCWIGVHYACHRSIGNHQTLDAAEPFLCWIETTEMIVLNQQLLSLAVQVIWDHIDASSIYMLLPWLDCLLSWLSETNLSFWLSKFCLEWHQVKWLLPGWELFLPLPHNCSPGTCKAMRRAAMFRWKLELKGFSECTRA